jgi:acyl carrier protein
MIDGKLKEKIDSIILAELGVNPASIDPGRPIQQQVCLDSMQFVGLVAKLEIELDLELPITIMEIATLAEFYSGLENVLSGKPDCRH